MRILAGLFFFTFITVFNSKAQVIDTVIVQDLAVSEIAEIDFTPPLPPPKNFKSPYTSISEWLAKMPLRETDTKNALFEFHYFQMEHQYFLYLKQFTPPYQKLPLRIQDDDTVYYHTVPVKAPEVLDWEVVNKKLVTEVKDFTRTESFKNSSLYASYGIINAYNQELIWYREPENADPELKKLREITAAVIDCNAENNKGLLVIDGEDFYLKDAEREKQKALTYFLLGATEKLQAFLENNLYRIFDPSDDIDEYIRKKTGVDSDVYAGAREKSEQVLSKNEISNPEEERAAYVMQSFYSRSGKELEKRTRLDAMLNAYRQQQSEKYKAAEISTVESTETPYRSPARITSPDGKFSFYLKTSGSGINVSTILQLSLDRVGTTVFTASCTQSDINAFWKNNNTIVVETKTPVHFTMKRHEIRSYDHVITVEYVQK